ncbi:lipid kinase YegS, partial [Cronobacter sakazakii]
MEFPFTRDGGPLSGQHSRIEVEPGALQCRLPPDCPLLK